ncbi:hypothetical protein J2T09_001479 [Neorhizobium huautlense]|uniref:Uncharacterized protein n=1 Tax=Neorhizobium huautlense TaxID=67774 RepID=A0ABT9PS82_9HYPH|nr:hypothetical protein [Neorhizobium huautlense]MDP9836734.1 hypothetical protein [Neorhizobium huautlense]
MKERTIRRLKRRPPGLIMVLLRQSDHSRHPLPGCGMQRRQQDRQDGGLTCSASAECLILVMACMVLLPGSAVNHHWPKTTFPDWERMPKQRQIDRFTRRGKTIEKKVRYAQPNPDLLATMSRMHRYSHILTGSLSPDLLACFQSNFFDKKFLAFPISISRYTGRPMARKEQPASKLDDDIWYKSAFKAPSLMNAPSGSANCTILCQNRRKPCTNMTTGSYMPWHRFEQKQLIFVIKDVASWR